MNIRTTTVAARCLAAALAAFAAAAPAQPSDSVSQLSWLAGCWVAEGREAGSMEVWLPPAGGTMLGLARTVRQQRTVEHEFMQIRRDDQGRLVFVAHPSGQREASFTATAVGPQDVVFENPGHDFPQRIAYRRTGADTLLARIEGQRNGRTAGVDFAWRRGSCEGAAVNGAPAPAHR